MGHDNVFGNRQDFWQYTPDTINKVVENAFINKLGVFPNPNSGNFQIFISDIKFNNSLEIFNCIGDIILQMHDDFNSEIDINLSSQPKGMYFIKIQQEGRTEVKKVVVM